MRNRIVSASGLAAIVAAIAAIAAIAAASPVAAAETALSGLAGAKTVRPGGGLSSIFFKPPARLPSFRRPPGAAAPSPDLGWFWTEAMPAAAPVAARGPGQVAAELVRLVRERRARGLPVYGSDSAARRLYARFRGEIDAAALAEDLSQALIVAVIVVESAGDPRAVSPKGARGLMQLMPGTAARFGVADAHDPRANVAGGAAYLGFLLGRFGGDLVLALAAYNAGEGAVDDYGGVPPFAETRDYVAKVFAAYASAQRLCRGAPDNPAAGCEIRDDI